MNRHLLWVLLCGLSLFSVGARAQTNVTYARETFEGITTGATPDYGYTDNNFNLAPTSGTQYFIRQSLNSSGAAYTGTTQPLTSQQGSYAFTGEGVRGTGSFVRPAGYVQLSNIPAANRKNFRMVVAMAAPRGGTYTGSGANGVTTLDRIRLQYSFDGNPWVTAGLLIGDNGNVGDFHEDTNLDSVVTTTDLGVVLDQMFRDVTANISGTGLQLSVRVICDTRVPELAFDNIRVIGDTDITANPTLTSLETSQFSYTEGGSAVDLTDSLVVGYSGGSTSTLTGATVSISSNFVSMQDKLTLTPSSQNGISSSFNSTTGVLTLSGTASQANYQTALRLVTYSNDNLTTLYDGTRDITFRVYNGTAMSNTPARTINIVGTLNAPAALPYTENFNTDGEGLRYYGNPFVFGTAGGFFRTTISPATYNSTQIGSVTFTNWSGGYWYGEGTSVNPTQTRTVQLAPVNATGAVNLNMVIAVGSSSGPVPGLDWDGADNFKLFYRANGGVWTQFGFFNGSTATGLLTRDGSPDSVTVGTALQDFTFPLPAAAAVGNLDFQLIQDSDGQEELAFDNIRISGTFAPTVTTGTAGSIMPTTASIITNTLSSSGGANISDYGVVYVAGTGTPTTSNSKVQVGTTSPGTFPNNFTANLTGLTAGIQYTARAYATNTAGTSYGSNITFTTSTTVASIVRNTPTANPTNASSISFTVAFASNVSGLSPSNFTLTNTGTATGTIASVTGSGITYTVTVNSVLGNGTIRLDLANATGLTPSVVTYNSGQAFTIDKTAPTVTITSTASSPTSSSPIPVTVTFSEAVTGFVAGDMTVTNSTISGFSGSGTTYTFNVTPATTGTVTVSVPANVAQDAANNGNTAATQFSIQYNQPQTAAPVVIAPANGSFVSTTTPSYDGTAPAGSIVTVYVDGSPLSSTVTTNGGGNWTLTQLTALSQGSHTVRATAQSNGATVSANSNTNTFTVQTPATYTSSTADQGITALAAAGTTNQEILRVTIVIGGGTGSPMSTTSFSFNTTGSTNAPADIDAARLYYTGTSSTFTTTNPFGSAIAGPNGAFTIPGTQQLINGTNYFFLVYNVDTNATNGNLLDATITSLTVGGTARTPTVTNPTGNRKIITTSRVAGGALRNSATSSGSTGNATVGYIDFSASPLPVLGPQYSQEVWIKPAFPNPQVTGLTYYVMGNGTTASPTAAPSVYVSSTGQVFAGFGTGSTFRSTSGTSANILSNGVWNHVVTTYDGTTMRIYVNGEIQFNSAPSGTGTPLSTAAVTYVGNATTTGSNFFPGDIDEISLWNRELSQTEIRLRRHLVRNGTENGLLAYLQFNESGGTTTDIVSGSVGTFTGTGSTRAASTAAVSSGTSSLQTVTANTTYAFPGTNTSIVFTGVTGSSETVMSRLEGRPRGTQPGIRTFSEAYWIVDKYTGGTFTSANVNYTLAPNQSISTADAATPGNLKLFKRGSNSDSTFDAPIAATAANALAGTVTFPVTSFSQMVIGSVGSSPLPVELIAFKAVQEGSAALLRWTTAQEENSDRFEVEASVDGQRFDRIGTVAGQGSTNSRTDYRFEDKQLLNYGTQRMYYRLRQLDWNGTFSYSPVRSISLHGQPAQRVQGLTLVPNPGHTTTLTGAPAGATVEVYDALGRRVLITPADVKGQAQLVLPAGLSSGIYIVRSGGHTARWVVE